MIASLRGELAAVTETGAVIDVHGVGYEVVLPASTRASLPSPGASVSLVVLTQVREDAITLYGFASEDQKQLYLALISVSQIGPKLALTILGHLSTAELVEAIVLGDTRRLSMVPGVGKKSAARMVLELRDKLPSSGDLAPGTLEETPAASRTARQELIDALQSLGFRPAEISGVLREVKPADDEPLDELLRRALTKLTPRGA